MIDTHCHIDVDRFDADRADVLARAFATGVQGIVVPGIEPASWSALLEWPRRDPRIQVALGIHPQALPGMGLASIPEAMERITHVLSTQRLIAIGECGLDGPTAERVPMAQQVDVLKAHLALARAHQLPVLMHCLRAHPVLLQVLAEEPPVERGVLLHSYSGSADLVKKYLAHNCFFSFAGPVTFAEARRPLDALKVIPLDRLMIETDAPDQAPHPFRGQRSEPALLPNIVDSMARSLGLAATELRARTTENARRFFAYDFAAAVPELATVGASRATQRS